MVALGPPSADEIANGPADRIVRSIDDVGLREVLDEVLTRDPEIAEMASRVSAAGHRTTSIRKLPDPRAEVTAFVLPPETRVGPQRFAARISQQIPGGGKRAISEKTADFGRRAIAADLQALRLAKVSETRRLVAEIRYIDEARRVLTEDQATLAHFEELARARYSSGSGLQMDAIQIQTEMTRLETRLANLSERRSGLVAEVNRLRDRPGAAIAEGPPLTIRAVEPTWDELRELALASRPELDADGARIQRSAALTELATKTASPDFSVGLTYAYVDRRTDVDVPKNGQDVLGISGGISIPIWKTGTDAEIEAATQLRLADEAAHRTTVAGIEREIESLMGRIPEIRRRLALLEDVLPIQSRQALSSAVSAYAAGRVDALALLDAERVLLDVRLSAARGRTDLALALIELEGAIAAPLPPGDQS
jgi:outer membrane protein TolC